MDTGTEPATARSALGLRLLLSVFFLPVFAIGCGGFSFWAAQQQVNESPSTALLIVISVICGILALVTVVDLAVIARRRRRSGVAGPARS
ncbi:DUF6343 family protein [Streptomyces sp. NPDC059944]|uniref:DUF6343 family protein n=1 Tax=unclassified Streptomyces TaxID=2593676 RepID=UPI0036336324